MRATCRHLFAPVDIASLVFFRIAFGAIMLWHVWRYFWHGLITRDYVEPTFRFTYWGFDWVRPWPGDGMYAHFYALGVLAVCITLGLWYRVSATLFFLGFTYVFLLDQALYLNHFYLVCLLSLLLIFVPAHRAVSIDAVLRPGLRADAAPAWALWLFRAQIGVVYFYVGLAKLNGDWLRGQPLRIWLPTRSDVPLIGPLFAQEWMALLFSYGALLFDLLIVPFLLWRRSRPLAFAVAVVFHLLNAVVFDIDIFPWLMIAATSLFFSPGWPRLGGFWPRLEAVERGEPAGTTRLMAAQRAAVVLLGIYLALQLLVPLRHSLYPGDVRWTGEGHGFAWRMLLSNKPARAVFFATDPVRQRPWEVDPLAYLKRWQVQKMAARPDLILQFSHHVAEDLRRQGAAQIEIRVWVVASLNGRRPQLLIDPTVDLAKQPHTLMPATWILPLDRIPRRSELKEDPPVPAIHYDLGRFYEQKGLSDDAVAEYRRTLSLDPAHARAHNNLGHLHHRTGLLDAAMAEYQQALAFDPNLALAHNNLAVAYYEKGDYRRAIHHHDRARELGFSPHPRFSEALIPHR